jgi:hypothetical protein
MKVKILYKTCFDQVFRFFLKTGYKQTMRNGRIGCKIKNTQGDDE